jgi:hypothetical protein
MQAVSFILLLIIIARLWRWSRPPIPAPKRYAYVLRSRRWRLEQVSEVDLLLLEG